MYSIPLHPTDCSPAANDQKTAFRLQETPWRYPDISDHILSSLNATSQKIWENREMNLSRMPLWGIPSAEQARATLRGQKRKLRLHRVVPLDKSTQSASQLHKRILCTSEMLVRNRIILWNQHVTFWDRQPLIWILNKRILEILWFLPLCLTEIWDYGCLGTVFGSISAARPGVSEFWGFKTAISSRTPSESSMLCQKAKKGR
jgi:hypothetical protein